MSANRLPGLALAITSGDEILYLKGYGTAGDGQPMTPRTQLYIASLSKSFTALAVMQLVEEGRIELDEPVQTYLPEFTVSDPSAVSKITVRQLLNQTSGLADSGFPEMTLLQPTSIEERIASLRDARPVSEPGAEFHYFDPNYAVLARIVEVESGEPFTGYLQTHVFMPLHMSNTTNVITSAETPRAVTDLAQGHILAFGVPFARPEMLGYLGGSGGGIPSAEDMANYLILQNDGGRFGATQLVSPENIALMRTPPDGADSSYAMGWTVPDRDAQPHVIEHSGVLSTFHSDAVLLPDEGYGIALLYNSNYALADYNGIKQGLIESLTDEQPAAGGLGAARIGIIIAALMFVTAALQVRGLLRLRKWAAKMKDRPVWQLVPGVVWKFIPATLVVGMPSVVELFAGRVFGYRQLFLSMPDIMFWLTLSAVLGTAAGVAHIILRCSTR